MKGASQTSVHSLPCLTFHHPPQLWLAVLSDRNRTMPISSPCRSAFTAASWVRGAVVHLLVLVGDAAESLLAFPKCNMSHCFVSMVVKLAGEQSGALLV